MERIPFDAGQTNQSVLTNILRNRMVSIGRAKAWLKFAAPRFD
ncbi:MAG: hypothetical protein M2R45_05200 [Verrucomicrobia subdivision 3 bacterium]|nr:hypothetical protein [Limisphaerales bacterium]MCS1417577.1 hypothetical protein [Limisphaerales bacterium]